MGCNSSKNTGTTDNNDQAPKHAEGEEAAGSGEPAEHAKNEDGTSPS